MKRRYLVKLLAAFPLAVMASTAFGRQAPKRDPLPELARKCRASAERLNARLYQLSGAPAPGGTPTGDKTPGDDLQAAMVALDACHYYMTQLER